LSARGLLAHATLGSLAVEKLARMHFTTGNDGELLVFLSWVHLNSKGLSVLNLVVEFTQPEINAKMLTVKRYYIRTGGQNYEYSIFHHNGRHTLFRLAVAQSQRHRSL